MKNVISIVAMFVDGFTETQETWYKTAARAMKPVAAILNEVADEVEQSVDLKLAIRRFRGLDKLLKDLEPREDLRSIDASVKRIKTALMQKNEYTLWESRWVRMPGRDETKNCLVAACTLNARQQLVALVPVSEDGPVMSVCRLLADNHLDESPLLTLSEVQYKLLVRDGEVEQLGPTGSAKLELLQKG